MNSVATFAILEIKDLSVAFGALRAIDSVTLSIAPGERHGILGPNGAGKTTLFNLICGELRPSYGKVYFCGSDITNDKPFDRVRKGLRRTYQTSLLFPALTVLENLLVAVRGVRRARMSLTRLTPASDAVEEAERLMEQVGLSEVAGRRVSELSHGQQRQLEISMALAGEPRLLLLDEPAAGLSPTERAMLQSLLLERIPRETAFILIEHDLDVALQVVEQVTVMQSGNVVTQGTPQQIMLDEEVQRIYLGAGDEAQ